ncbi:MAG TPA: DUF456 domain-containing protein [Bacteroidales bacterium]|jgi:hypothetical protein|nr:DUF456 domain-containing protein [Bacteroidales bacterium]MDD4235277.1 DUF456 domain-containing protein [Bacteroidales bacterium]MDY0161019.1 DUF456 domain-containing protein [Bacteroidales bacterium]HXK82679.1 DUF456 domain-containing protein [Bacteroidales bacterium]
MIIDVVLLVLGTALIIIGLIGCIVPVIPGPPISYGGILLLHFTSWVSFSLEFMLIWAVLVIAVTVLDYLVPIWGTKKSGGSKWGTWGSAIGLVVGLFFSPIGIFVGPFFGALVGELMYQYKKDGKDIEQPVSENQKMKKSLKAAFGSFLGLMVGIVLKLIVSGALAFSFVRAVFKAVF